MTTPLVVHMKNREIEVTLRNDHLNTVTTRDAKTRKGVNRETLRTRAPQKRRGNHQDKYTNRDSVTIKAVKEPREHLTEVNNNACFADQTPMSAATPPPFGRPGGRTALGSVHDSRALAELTAFRTPESVLQDAQHRVIYLSTTVCSSP